MNEYQQIIIYLISLKLRRHQNIHIKFAEFIETSELHALIDLFELEFSLDETVADLPLLLLGAVEFGS